MVPPPIDRRTCIFLFLCSSVVVCSVLCMIGSMGVPYVSRISALAYQGALLSAAAGFTAGQIPFDPRKPCTLYPKP